MCRRCSNGTSTSADIFSLLEANIRYAIADGVCRKVISAECSSTKRNEILSGHCLIYNFNSISYTSHKFHRFRTDRTTGFNESGNVLEVVASPSRWTEEQVLGGTTQYHFLFFLSASLSSSDGHHLIACQETDPGAMSKKLSDILPSMVRVVNEKHLTCAT